MRLIDVGHKFGMETASIFRPLNPVVHWNISIAVVEYLAKNGEVDLISFGGGGDIHPSLYGHRNVGTHCGNSPSYRDLFELEVWKIAQQYELPILGICRGAQLACALSGGELIQDIDHRHGEKHIMETFDGKFVPMTSVHHQMMHPYRIKDFKLIAWINPPKEDENFRRYYEFDSSRIKRHEIKVEPEIIYFPRTKALAIQGHPEFYGDANHPSVQYVRELVDQFLFGRE